VSATLPNPSPPDEGPGNDHAVWKSRGRTEGWFFSLACRAATWSGCAVLAVLLLAIAFQAWGWLDWQFLTSFDSRKPVDAGIAAGIWGTGWMILLTIVMAAPIGIGAAIYLEEYARDTWLTRIIQINLSNLAGVPSIVYGILGLTAFVRMFGMFEEGGLMERLSGESFTGITLWTDAATGEPVRVPLPFGRTVISGALTMVLLILPVIIVTSQEALRAVPQSLRHASYALGATRWQTIRQQVLPSAMPGVMTGLILSISRAIGETAPLVMIGAMTFVYFAPGGITHPTQLVTEPDAVVRAPFDIFTVMPIQIFNWVRQSKPEFQNVAAAGILVLLAVLLLLNGLAIYIRQRYQKNLQW
jgi:phosphate transport system permease protein